MLTWWTSRTIWLEMPAGFKSTMCLGQCYRHHIPPGHSYYFMIKECSSKSMSCDLSSISKICIVQEDPAEWTGCCQRKSGPSNRISHEAGSSGHECCLRHHESSRIHFRGEFATSTAASLLHILCTWGMPQSELSATVMECSFVGISALRLHVCTEQRFLTSCSRYTISMPCRSNWSNQQFHPRMFECISNALKSSNGISSFTRFWRNWWIKMKALMHRSCLSALETLFSAVGAARAQQKFAETSSCRDCWAMFLGWDDGRWSGDGMRSCAATHPISLPRSWLRREAKWIQDNPEESVANRKGLSWLLNLPNVLFRLMFVRLDLYEWAILSLCEGGGKGKQQKEKAKTTQAAVVMCFSIALLLFLRDLNVRNFQLNLRQRLVGRSVPRLQHPYLFRFGVLYSHSHSGFQSDSSIFPWDSITAMQLQLGGTKVTAYGKASWIWSVLVDCLWNICGTYSYMNIYCTWLLLLFNPLNICQGTAAHLLHRTLHGFLVATIVQSMAICMDLSLLLAK